MTQRLKWQMFPDETMIILSFEKKILHIEKNVKQRMPFEQYQAQ